MANKLYPLKSISHQIEEFAKEMLLTVISGDASETADGEVSIAETPKVLMCIYFLVDD